MFTVAIDSSWLVSAQSSEPIVWSTSAYVATPESRPPALIRSGLIVKREVPGSSQRMPKKRETSSIPSLLIRRGNLSPLVVASCRPELAGEFRGVDGPPAARTLAWLRQRD